MEAMTRPFEIVVMAIAAGDSFGRIRPPATPSSLALAARQADKQETEVFVTLGVQRDGAAQLARVGISARNPAC